MLEALKNKLNKTTRQITDGTKTFLEDANFKVTESEQQRRYAICESCPEFHQKTHFCRTCGCYMPLKTWVAAVGCPIKKWIPIKNN